MRELVQSECCEPGTSSAVRRTSCLVVALSTQVVFVFRSVRMSMCMSDFVLNLGPRLWRVCFCSYDVGLGIGCKACFFLEVGGSGW